MNSSSARMKVFANTEILVDDGESEDRFGAIESALTMLPRAMMRPEGTHGNQDDHNL